MSKLKNDFLFTLIKSLSKAEKRHLRMNTFKGKQEKPPLFIQLFDPLDKASKYNEKELLSAIPDVKKKQLSNLKAHLYNHILESLRWLSRQKDMRIHIRQLIDYAQVLYNKGLYQQSLKLLEKAKSLSITHHEVELKMQVLEFEKVIEARHITRSLENRAENLSKASRQCLTQLSNLSHLSNLALNMYGMYLKMGHVGNEKEALMLRTYFENNLHFNNVHGLKRTADESRLSFSTKGMTFYEKVNLYQAFSWYAYILQDFLLFYRYAQKWVDLFEEYSGRKIMDPPLYLKALHNLLTAHFFNRNYKKFCNALITLELFWKDHKKRFNKNTATMAFIYTYTAKINKHFLEGTFQAGVVLVPEFERELKEHRPHMDRHRVLVFYYKIACLYFGSGDNNTAIIYLNKIINLKIGNLRADIQCFARILHLIAHYELKNYDLIEYLLPSVYNFLDKHKQLSAVLVEILKFIKDFNHLGIRGLRKGFIDLKERLQKVGQNPYERRFFLYLDVLSWLESKINRQPVQAVIREKFIKKVPRI